jgi:phospholipid/cholesterol/gamma-HCH transport system permease protein
LSAPTSLARETAQYPVVQRASIRFFRRITRFFTSIFRDIGLRTYFARDIARGFGDPATYLPETLRQMKNIGVDSVPLTLMVAAFIGAVIAYQTRYQLFPGVQLSIIGLASRLMVVLELGPLLTGLVLTGRVGGRMTAEIGTMRVTEQIDALTTLSTDPFKYLVWPRLIAGLLMLPLLVIVANIIGVFGGYIVGIYKLGFGRYEYINNTFEFLETEDVVSGLVKAAVFGFLVALMGCYQGYHSEGGAQGVGAATTKAVVSASILILTANYIITELFFSR